MRSLAVKHSLCLIDIGNFFVREEMRYFRILIFRSGKAREVVRSTQRTKKRHDVLRKLAHPQTFFVVSQGG